MRMWNFNTMLLWELQMGRETVLGLLLQRDRLKYVEAPPLRKKYMELIGGAEQTVLEQELEVALLRRKAELFQIAVNRQEKLDISEIEDQLERERQAKRSELEGADATLRELPELSEEASKELTKLYKQIVRDFHPAVHKDLTDAERALFDRALEAYQHQDLEAMRMLHDIMYQSSEKYELELNLSGGSDADLTPEQVKEEYLKAAEQVSADYTLAKTLYGCFRPTEEDSVVLGVLEELKEKRLELLADIDSIRAGFPFNAMETMDNSDKTQEYLAELRIRTKLADRERQELTERVQRLAEVMTNG